MGIIQYLNSDPTLFISLVICLIFSLCFHEFSHSLMALLLGDDTSYKLKRTNMNPINHLDPIGTTTQNGTPVQPEDDHTEDGNICFVTGNGDGSGGEGQADVDGGYTTLYSPEFNFELS